MCVDLIMQNHRFDITMPCWGDRYRDVLLNASLPLQLAKGNLQDFPWVDQSKYIFYTTFKDAEIIKKHQAYHLLKDIINTEFVYIDNFINSNQYKSKWSLFRHCHKSIANAADARDAAVFYIQPDMLIAPNSLTRAAEYVVYKNKSAVFTTGIRGCEEKIVTELRTNYKKDNYVAIDITNRQLIELLLKHPHPETLTWTWGDKNYLKIPTYVLFNIQHEGLLAYAYILHPFLVKPEHKFVEFGKIIDQSYILAACPDVTKHYICQDSDEIAFIEISPEHMDIPGIPPEIKDLDPITAMAYRGETDYNYIHRQMVNYPLKMHSTDLTPEKWQPYENFGNMTINQIQQIWDMNGFELFKKHPIVLGQRLFKKMSDSQNKLLRYVYKLLRYFVVISANYNKKTFYYNLLVRIYSLLNKNIITKSMLYPLVKFRKIIILKYQKIK